MILFELLKRINAKFIMYYHNDPLTMSGSKSISERNEISKVDKLVFISEWVEKDLEGLDSTLKDKTEIIYHSTNKRKKN